MIEWMKDSNREGTLPGERVVDKRQSTREEKEGLQKVHRSGR